MTMTVSFAATLTGRAGLILEIYTCKFSHMEFQNAGIDVFETFLWIVLSWLKCQNLCLRICSNDAAGNFRHAFFQRI